ncbi:hypothetical protein HDU78_004873 [Chytriomyces hyalinus]|nr:hypothetical protein HDU78_004873 [Chytriomyces hyalinus]
MGDKAKKKAYITKSTQVAKPFTVQSGMRGVLGFCRRGKEQLASKELIAVLEEYADKLYGEIGGSGEKVSGSGEIEDAFAREVAAIKESGLADKSKKRFVWLNVGIECCLFVKCSAEIDPTQLVTVILADMNESKVQKSRYIQRILPATETCNAYLDQITALAKRLLPPHFSVPGMSPKKFAVVFNRRNNHDVTRDDVIPVIAQIVTEVVEHTVDIKEPEYCILVEIFKGVCAMSVVQRFYELKKFNFETILGINASAKALASNEASKAAADTERVDTKDATAAVEPEEKPASSSTTAREKKKRSAASGERSAAGLTQETEQPVTGSNQTKAKKRKNQ